jgi:GDP-L-fucose synthase
MSVLGASVSNAQMNTASRIYIAGHRGLVGSALVRELARRGYRNVITQPHQTLELRDARAVARFLAQVKPDVIFLAAARVGGILANDTHPADFIRDNLLIETNVIHEAANANIKSLLFFGSSCMYPRDAAQPIRESALMTGPLEATNRPYGVAKIAGTELCWAYNRQYGTRFLCVVPTGIYGSGDNYDLQASHVLPALIRRFHEAKERRDKEVVLWGTGEPRREFLHSDDLAAACIHLMELPAKRIASLFAKDEPPLLNVGGGEELSINDLAQRVREVIGADVLIRWDTTKPDGTPRKALDSRRLTELGWAPAINFSAGLRDAYANFLEKQVDA